ncbi:DedA family protein [Achromobacter denitrificans]|jgi:membrane protein DedA with SNARE-associated domain|uniref:DedA family protein n=1 Tax=Achromobacter denitrificans TaxID=32002 RepID=A0A427WRJ8_ACHDE|nr:MULTISPECIES: DedA family protein [Achromobacter]ASC63042.1 DedA family protein [Achromobacter denitrificans]MBV2157630.1 DedA family protein [Achromobacter denitrificans]MDF3850021.1 DedA family protein [Achromobacter denitrificans]MDF3944577.1 DedA family protein [Achromobacter denitrificans]MDX3880414.1 DedA family protein [Achromobacter sp.]
MNPALHQFIVDYGLWAVLAGTFLEGESVVVLAGFLAHQRLLHLPEVMLCAFAGSFVADQLLFYLGRRYREHRYVRRIREQPAFGKALDLVDRYPHGFILALRFLYGLRTVGPVALGVSRVSPLRFLALNAVAAAIWAVCFSALGYVFGQTIESMLGRLHGVETKLAVAAGIGVAIWLAYHLYARHARRRK